MADAGWFILKCPPKREAAVRIILNRQGLISLAPREVYFAKATPSERKASPGLRWAMRERPLFARLVFVRIARHQDWDAIRRMCVQPNERDTDTTVAREVPFVQGFLSMDGTPYRLSDKDVTMLYNVDGLQTPQPVEARKIRPNDKAKITVGAFAGHPCEVQAVAGKRAKVLMMLLGSMKVIEVPVDSLEAA